MITLWFCKEWVTIFTGWLTKCCYRYKEYMPLTLHNISVHNIGVVIHRCKRKEIEIYWYECWEFYCKRNIGKCNLLGDFGHRRVSYCTEDWGPFITESTEEILHSLLYEMLRVCLGFIGFATLPLTVILLPHIILKDEFPLQCWPLLSSLLSLISVSEQSHIAKKLACTVLWVDYWSSTKCRQICHIWFSFKYHSWTSNHIQDYYLHSEKPLQR